MHYDIYRDRSGEWRWRFVASNGQVVGTSGEGYVRKSDCLHGIELMKESAGAPIRED